MKYLPYCLSVILIIISDQISKFAILARFDYAERLNIIPHFFDLILVFNPGAAFSFLANMGGIQKYIFTLGAILFSFYLARAIAKNEFGRVGNFAAAAIIGGALGNAIDRLIHGQVIDFLLFYWKNWYYPAFNIADCFICIGVFYLLLSNLFQKKKKQTL